MAAVTPSSRPKRRAASDEAYLAEIESCWTSLAAGIARGNRRLPLEEVERAARQAVAMLTFLAMCRRRRLLSEPALEPPAGRNRPGLWLGDLLRAAEDQLGPGLVHLDPGGNGPRDPRADLSTLRIDGKTLAATVSRLRTSSTAIDLAAQPAAILGKIHERLIGRRLCRTPDGLLTVRASPKARKTNGVFYTPDYITQYIVRNSLGRTGDSQGAHSSGARIPHVLDPACGCGAFLLAAGRRLLARLKRQGVSNAPAAAAKHLHGTDIDADAVLTARRSLWLEMMDSLPRAAAQRSRGEPPAAQRIAAHLAENIQCADVLSDRVLDRWSGRFDLVIGNPPYRRELRAKRLLDRIAATQLGRRYRAPRMDLWYYFVHRGLELLRPGGRLAYIVGSYWISGSGAQKLILTLREMAHVEEVFCLDRLKVFPGVAGRHMILSVTKRAGHGPTTIKRAVTAGAADAEPFVRGTAPVAVFRKSPEQLFRGGRVDLEPPCDRLLAKLARWTPLGALGTVRQGIVENPAAVTRRTNERYGNCWEVGQGVFALTPAELDRLKLPDREMRLVRPYHDLCDLGRYWLAEEPSLLLIYSTPETCPDIQQYPTLRDHLARFRPIMEARRETRQGVRPWWQLHWPREERLWQSAKIISVQMGARPAFVPATLPAYVPFSTNVFLPRGETREHVSYLTALLGSRLMWKWYRHHAKRRGVGLEINGHVLARTPIRTIDFSDPSDRSRHNRLVELVDRLLLLHRRQAEKAAKPNDAAAIDRRIDELVYELYGLADDEISLVDMETSNAC